MKPNPKLIAQAEREASEVSQLATMTFVGPREGRATGTFKGIKMSAGGFSISEARNNLARMVRDRVAEAYGLVFDSKGNMS